LFLNINVLLKYKNVKVHTYNSWSIQQLSPVTCFAQVTAVLPTQYRHKEPSHSTQQHKKTKTHKPPTLYFLVWLQKKNILIILTSHFQFSEFRISFH